MIDQVRAKWPPDGLEYVRQCPVCGDDRREEELTGLEDRVFGAAPGKWTLQRCLNCRTAYLDPRPNQQTIGLAYQNYFTHIPSEPSQPATILAWLRRALANGYRNSVFGTHLQPSLTIGGVLGRMFPATVAAIRAEGRSLHRWANSGGRVLDVGCGNGRFLVVARQMGWHCYGVEIDSVAAAVSRNEGIDVLGGQVSDLDCAYDDYFDAVTLSHVIEHVHDPVDLLRQCRRVMKPGAHIWIETPNIESVGYAVYGRHWRGLEPPRHLTLFNTESIQLSLQRAGFERIRLLPPAPAVAGYTFTLSARTQAGQIAELESKALSAETRRQIGCLIRRADSVVRVSPDRAEFITVEAYRPHQATERSDFDRGR